MIFDIQKDSCPVCDRSLKGIGFRLRIKLGTRATCCGTIWKYPDNEKIEINMTSAQIEQCRKVWQENVLIKSKIFLKPWERYPAELYFSCYNLGIK